MTLLPKVNFLGFQTKIINPLTGNAEPEDLVIDSLSHSWTSSFFLLSRPFSLDHFDDYQKHFTVMNYAEGVELKQVFFPIVVLPFSSS